MKKLIHLASAIAVAMTCASAIAETLTFKTSELSGAPLGHVYPGLDLQGITDVRIVAGDDSELVDGRLQSIKSVEFVFPNANNLVVKNLKSNGSEYVGVADDAWVYSGVRVALHIEDTFSDNARFDAHVNVVESENKLNNQPPSNFNSALFDVHGILKDDREKILADTVSFDHEGKPLTLSVFRNMTANENNEPMINVNINWQGHGVADVQAFSQFPREELHNMKLIGINVPNPTDPQPTVEYSLIDKQGMVIKLEKTLEWLKSEAGF
jgi:hypothetical protein